MDYEVIYSASYRDIPISVYIFFIIFIIFIAIFYNKDKIFSDRRIIIWMRFMMPFFVIVCMGTIYNYISAWHSLKVGEYKVIEGKVENFSPASNNPKGYEYFLIGGKKFLYSHVHNTGGLNHSLVDSGISNGSEVRIYYKGEAILKVEMKK